MIKRHWLLCSKTATLVSLSNGMAPASHLMVWRCPRESGKWSLTSLQQRLVKTGGQLIQHARYYWLLLAESHLTRRLFAGMLAKIAMLPSPAG